MTEAAPPLPARYCAPELHIVDDAMPAEWVSDAGRWLFEHRADLERVGDDDGASMFRWDTQKLDTLAPDLTAKLRARVLELLPVAMPAIGSKLTAPTFMPMTAALYHHGGHYEWHQDQVVAFELTLRTTPTMFSGGEVEFLDGTLVEPANGRLAFFGPNSVRRVRRVECWSAHVLHGRWSVLGWLQQS